MYKDVLKIDFVPEWEDIECAVRDRHIIVHRNGKPNKGDEIFIMREEVERLVKIAETFVEGIEKQIVKE